MLAHRPPPVAIKCGFFNADTFQMQSSLPPRLLLQNQHQLCMMITTGLLC